MPQTVFVQFPDKPKITFGRLPDWKVRKLCGGFSSRDENGADSIPI